jgi:hypothetical protein
LRHPATGIGAAEGETWFEPIEARSAATGGRFIEELIEQEPEAALGRGRYERAGSEAKSYRNGTRERRLPGSFIHQGDREGGLVCAHEFEDPEGITPVVPCPPTLAPDPS